MIQHHISKSADQLQNLGVIIGQLRIEHITTNQPISFSAFVGEIFPVTSVKILRRKINTFSIAVPSYIIAT